MRNKKPVEKHPIHVKSGDKVVVTSGKDKGKVSSVKKVITSENKVVVEGANIVTKAQKAQGGNQGGLIKMEAPMDSSKVMLYCPACEKATRIKYSVVDNKKVRICKKCGEKLD
ncbi:MAG: 50S ribosomal protein L24 [Candidatus Gastranaerophilales bacterium]|nr:50S ribosomal protein L24 [Candidatus Gastranaerophilales bacterium]